MTICSDNFAVRAAAIVGTVLLALLLLGTVPASALRGFGKDNKVRTRAITSPRFVVTSERGRIFVADRERVIGLAPGGKRLESFGGDGTVEPTTADGATIRGLAAEPDGGFVTLTAVGAIRQGFSEVEVARYDADGEPVSGFGAGGTLLTPLSGGFYFDPLVVVDGLGNITVGLGSTLMRFTPTGAPNANFGSGGAVALDSTQVGGDMVLDSSGRLLVLTPPLDGTSPTGTDLVRLLPDGQPDTTFAGDGGTELFRLYYAYLAVAGSGDLIYAGTDPCGTFDFSCGQGVTVRDGLGQPVQHFGPGSLLRTYYPFNGLVADSKGRLALVGTYDQDDRRAGRSRGFYLVRFNFRGKRRGRFRFAEFGDDKASLSALSDPRNDQVIAIGRVRGHRNTGGIARFSLK